MTTALQGRLQDFVEDRLSGVIERICYVDTIQILLPPLRKELMRGLYETGAGEIISEESKCEYFPWLRRIHQPTEATIRFLIALNCKYVINRFDCALDLIVGDRRTAEGLCVFLRTHLTQPWRGKRELRLCESTLYFTKAWKPRNIAIYPARSKKTVEWAAHIEFRYCHAASCRRIGIRSLGDIATFDPVSAITRACRFSMLHPARFERSVELEIGKAVMAHNRRKSLRPVTRAMIDRRFREILSRSLCLRDDERVGADYLRHMSVQNWLDTYPEIARPAVVHITPAALVKGVGHRIELPPL